MPLSLSVYHRVWIKALQWLPYFSIHLSNASPVFSLQHYRRVHKSASSSGQSEISSTWANRKPQSKLAKLPSTNCKTRITAHYWHTLSQISWRSSQNFQDFIKERDCRTMWKIPGYCSFAFLRTKAQVYDCWGKDLKRVKCLGYLGRSFSANHDLDNEIHYRTAQATSAFGCLNMQVLTFMT